MCDLKIMRNKVLKHVKKEVVFKIIQLIEAADKSKGSQTRNNSNQY